MRYVAVLILAVVLGGCTAAPALRPVEARGRLLADPRVAAWYTDHSAPAILGGMSPRVARRWRKYQPAVMFDRVTEGYRVSLEAEFGPEPRKLEALMDPKTGAVLSLQER
ncbi:MAG TPA: hypothetical protein VNT01_11370 [Symbiobacteriaceae bacterium]|nr:hypothetical protein [Symbiobacteriaceae bacterium]